jgi:hypothetical protein
MPKDGGVAELSDKRGHYAIRPPSFEQTCRRTWTPFRRTVAKPLRMKGTDRLGRPPAKTNRIKRQYLWPLWQVTIYAKRSEIGSALSSSNTIGLPAEVKRCWYTPKVQLLILYNTAWLIAKSVSSWARCASGVRPWRPFSRS